MTPETRDFLDQVRDGDDPTQEDERRVRAAVRAAVAVGGTAGAGVGVSQLGRLLAAFGTPAAKVTGVTLGVVAVAGAAVVTIQTRPALGPASPAAVAQPPSAGASEIRPVLTASSPAEPVAEARPTAPAPGPSRVRPKRARRARSLQAELELLAAVQDDIKRGRGQDALRRLDGHDTDDTQLLEERQAARILALCAAGRTAQARQAAAVFMREHPASAHRAVIERSCTAHPRGRDR